MSVKILINALGQHLIADTRQVSNKETEELVAYWVRDPRAVVYNRNEDGSVTIDFANPCPISSSTEYAIATHHIVSVLDPLPEVEERYQLVVAPAPQLEVTEAPETEVVEDEVVETEVVEDGVQPE